jgi:hypothetical protein
MSFPQFGEIIQKAVPDEETQGDFPQFGTIIDKPSMDQQRTENLLSLLKDPTKLELTRRAGQLAARGLEAIVSTPRGVGEFLQKAVPKKTLIKGAEKIGLGKGARALLDATEKYAPYKLFPTHEQTRQFTKDLFGETFEPKSEWEAKAGETFGEFSSLVFPFLGAVKPLRAFLLSTGANAMKQIGEWLGLSEKKSNLMKLGTYVFGSFVQPKAAENFYQKNYKAASESLPENATVSSTRLISRLDSLEKEMMKGGISSADRPALQQIKNIRETVEGAQVPIDGLTAVKRKINIERGAIYKALEGNKPGIRTAHRNMERVSNTVDASLKEYAKHNPRWGKFYREANNAFSATENSKIAAKFLKTNVGKFTIKHAGLAALLGHLGAFKGIAIGVATGAPAYIATRTLNRIMRSKPLRNEFLRLYQESLRGNLPAVARSVKMLDQGVGKLEE